MQSYLSITNTYICSDPFRFRFAPLDQVFRPHAANVKVTLSLFSSERRWRVFSPSTGDHIHAKSRFTSELQRCLPCNKRRYVSTACNAVATIDIRTMPEMEELSIDVKWTSHFGECLKVLCAPEASLCQSSSIEVPNLESRVFEQDLQIRKDRYVQI